MLLYVTSPLFKQNFILKFQDKTCLENILFVSKSLNNLTPSVFSTWFSFSSDQHNHETSSSTHDNLTKLFYKTNRYVKYSITVSAVEPSKKIQKQLKDMLLKDLSPKKIKTIVSNFYLKSYQQFIDHTKKWSSYVTLLIHKNFISIISYMSQISVYCINFSHLRVYHFKKNFQIILYYCVSSVFIYILML